VNISTKGRYGLRALLELAKNPNQEPMPLAYIAKAQNLSEGYLEQLMMPLKKSGLVKSVRGAQGGYLLTRHPSEIRIDEVMTILEGPLYVTSCVGEGEKNICHEDECCAARALWEELHKETMRILRSYSLEDLIKGK